MSRFVLTKRCVSLKTDTLVISRFIWKVACRCQINGVGDYVSCSITSTVHGFALQSISSTKAPHFTVLLFEDVELECCAERPCGE